MPVQINELVIRANVVEPGQQGKTPEPKSGGKSDGNADIIRECVAQVLEILQSKNQR